MTTPRIGPCVPWATVDEVRAFPQAQDSLPANTLVTEAINFATGFLFRRSGQQFDGPCTSSVRPTSRSLLGQMVGSYRFASWGGSDSGSYSLAQQLGFAWGSCGCGDASRCGAGGRAIRLGDSPITSITTVLIDGATVDPSMYHVQDWRWLVHHDGIWPTCQNLDLAPTEVGTFEVTFVHGQPPPPEARKAAAALACQLAKAWRGDTDCQLNERVTSVSRDGYSMQLVSPGDLFKPDGSTGVKEVDLFLSAWNPHRLQSRATISSPDLGRPAVRRT